MSRASSSGTLPHTVTPSSARTVNRWFVWKEARQLLPLIVALVFAAGTMLAIRFLQTSRSGLARDTPLFIMAFPILFAVGGGTVLVGQEREQRTLQWLRSLPISSPRLIWTKIGTSLVGLALMWVMAILAIIATGVFQLGISPWVIRDLRSTVDDLAPVSYPLWMTYSVYVLLCSFFASWRIKNPLLAIVAVAPLACVPLVVCELGLATYQLFDQQHYRQPYSYLPWCLAALASIPVMGWLTHRMGSSVLAPRTPPRIRIVDLSKVARPSRSVIAQTPTFRSQTAAIVWQFIHSSPVSLLILSAMVLIGVLGPMKLIDNASLRGGQSTLLLGGMLLLLGASWLGVLAFKFDGSAAQLRFAADRGFSPTSIYIARHAVPIAIISIAMVVYAIYSTDQSAQAVDWSRSSWRASSKANAPSLLNLLLITAVIYAVSQWTSQMLRMLILALIIAPLLSLLVLRWWFYAAFRLQSPLWMLAAFAILPMLATWWMMPRYMDMRDRRRGLLVGFGLATALLAIPTVPAVTEVVRSLRSQRVNIAELIVWRDEGRAYAKAAPRSVTLDVSFFRTDIALPADQQQNSIPRALKRLPDLATSPEEFIPCLVQMRQEPELALVTHPPTWKAVFSRLMLERVRFEQSSNDGNAEPIASFAPWVESAAVLLQSLRRSPRWYDQEVADRMEIWLVDTLNSRPLAMHRDADFFTNAVARIPTHRERQSARRGAVLASLARRQDFPQESTLEARSHKLYQRLDEVSHELPFGIIFLRFTSITPIALDALSDAPASKDQDSWQRRMHENVFEPSDPFEVGPYAPRLRDIPAIVSVDDSVEYPGRYWGMAWEIDAEALKSSVEASR